jgi:murein DD-endopeptidase MepM/ murein hydrolase activator NlpD
MREDSSSPNAPLTRRDIRKQGRSRASALTTPESVVAEIAPERRAAPKLKRGKSLLTRGTLFAIPLLLVGLSLPANLFYPAENSLAVASEIASGNRDTATQSFTVASSESKQVGVQRESWIVTSFAEVLKARYGTRSFTYSTTGVGSIRWPFPTAVPISSGYGGRTQPCRYCSSFHRGLDFVPGNGSPIFAVADGVVLDSQYGGGYGQFVSIEHTLNGQSIVTVYAHMQRGSSPLAEGDTIRAGKLVGLVGNTGVSTGPHLHLEVRINGEKVDPFAWLQLNAF